MKKILAFLLLTASPALAYELPGTKVTLDNLAHRVAIAMLCEPDNRKANDMVFGATMILLTRGEMHERGDGEKLGERIVHWLRIIRQAGARDQACAYYANGTWSVK